MQAQSRILKNTATGHLLVELLLVWYQAGSVHPRPPWTCCNTVLSLAVFSCGIDQYLRFCALNSGCKQLSFSLLCILSSCNRMAKKIFQTHIIPCLSLSARAWHFSSLFPYSAKDCCFFLLKFFR